MEEIDVDPSLLEQSSKEAINFQVGDLVLIKTNPCRIVNYTASKPGKCGRRKVLLVGIDILTCKKHELMCIWNQVPKVPLVNRTEYRLLRVCEGLAELEDLERSNWKTLALPTDMVGETITEMCSEGKDVIVTVLSVMGQEAIVAAKDAQCSDESSAGN